MQQSAAPAGDAITLFCLHALGGSARSWDGPSACLGDGVRCVGIDLPGFGDTPMPGRHEVEQLADHVAELVRVAAPVRWGLLGNSMGAKVALAVARRAEDGEAGLSGLERLVLMAGSPPSPEPIPEERRREMLQWFRDGPARDREQARIFVAANVSSPLPADREQAAVEDVLRADKRAWRAWLTVGAAEDWQQRIGVLRTPALVLAGRADADLGPDAQRALMLPHLAHGRLLVLDAGHLLPLERPKEVADAVAAFVRKDGAFPGVAAGPVLPDEAYRAFIASDRVSRRVRAALEKRMEADDPAYAPQVLTPVALALLRAVMARVLPQTSDEANQGTIDLAARLDAQLAAGGGDGWRVATLPPDAEAYERGLRTLDAVARQGAGCPFLCLDGAGQDALLHEVQAGQCRADGLSPHQMLAWFEDVRGDAVRLFVSHPATMARLGYGGIGNGGDEPRLRGFDGSHLDRREAWEPRTPPGPGRVLAETGA
ncbi:alpha/beta hydrolase [Rhizosaccharibacter radicis]|uniref:Alpha/beta hydrolase n=1 Tax=Rhizosaccharibacter radicis TaxID=2782605 RepID=A0ABT1VUY0_9PROT|nr:alpha/beta hydrolase [Acetobacteraceae bacterium KSS12]